MRLSVKRADAIYDAVFDRLMKLRVELSLGDLKDHPGKDAIDVKIARALDEAAREAVKAARGEM